MEGYFKIKLGWKRLMKTLQIVCQNCGICTPKCSNLLYKCAQNSGDIKKVRQWGISGGKTWF